MILADRVAAADDASLHIDLTGKLPPGQFTLSAQITVNANAMDAEIRCIPIEVSSPR